MRSTNDGEVLRQTSSAGTILVAQCLLNIDLHYFIAQRL
jgi:hypothetical protein